MSCLVLSCSDFQLLLFESSDANIEANSNFENWTVNLVIYEAGKMSSDSDMEQADSYGEVSEGGKESNSEGEGEKIENEDEGEETEVKQVVRVKKNTRLSRKRKEREEALRKELRVMRKKQKKSHKDKEDR
mgnify:CR=1 FL=1